ncbi:hypothetical protein TrVE_jg11032 [Triparma verrucosa]|uniref:Uncharacterized protein n=1 Tax=Triparma verrucosa TaxID=1606542 RepID=A0A9W7FJ98_9STRA|nr:hypothetical protein TrVE_jg11032 [Triparma verrucosa]
MGEALDFVPPSLPLLLSPYTLSLLLFLPPSLPLLRSLTRLHASLPPHLNLPLLSILLSVPNEKKVATKILKNILKYYDQSWNNERDAHHYAELISNLCTTRYGSSLILNITTACYGNLFWDALTLRLLNLTPLESLKKELNKKVMGYIERNVGEFFEGESGGDNETMTVVKLAGCVGWGGDVGGYLKRFLGRGGRGRWFWKAVEEMAGMCEDGGEVIVEVAEQGGGEDILRRLYDKYDPMKPSVYTPLEVNSIMAAYMPNLELSDDVKNELGAYQILNGGEGELDEEYDFLL